MAAPRVAVALDTSRLKRATVAVASSDPAPAPERREIITAVGPEGVALATPAASVKRLVIPLPSSAPPAVSEAQAPLPAEPRGEGVAIPARPLTDAELTALAAQSLVEEARSGVGLGVDGPQVLGPKLVIPAVGGEPTAAAAAPHSTAAFRGSGAARTGGGGSSSAADAELRDRLFRPDQQRVRGSGQGGAAPMLARQAQEGPAAAAAAAADSDRERLAADLTWRAADLDAAGETYDAVPIAEFGAAMLRGMGVAEAVIAADAGPGDGGGGGPRARPQGLGLGAQVAPQLEAEGRKRTVRPGDPLPAAGAGAAAVGGGGASRKFPGVVTGAVVQVMKGRFTAKVGIVVTAEGVPGLDMCKVRVVAVGRASFAAPSASGGAAAAPAPALTEADTEVTVVPKRDVRPISASELTAGAEGGLGDQAAHVPLLTAAENSRRAAERAAERARHANLVAKADKEEKEEAAAAQQRRKRDDGREGGGGSGSGRRSRSRDAVRRRESDDRGRERRDEGERRRRDERDYGRRSSRSRSYDRDRHRRHEGGGRDSRCRRDDDDDAGAGRSSRHRDDGGRPTSPPPPPAWLVPGISVRFAASERGRWAGSEGVIVDVPRPGVCTLRVLAPGAGAPIEGVPQRVLVPVPPLQGGACVVLRGPHRLRRGAAIELGGGSCFVRLLDDEDEEVVRVPAADVAAIR